MNRHRGFTLIEILVTLALMAMISTILIASLTFGGHVWQKAIGIASNTEEVAQAQKFLRAHLSSLVFTTGRPFGASVPQGLSSDGTSLEFTAESEAAGSALLRYKVDVSSSRVLQVQSTPVRPNAGQNVTSGTPEPLLRNVASIEIQFWVQSADAPGQWVGRWSDLARVPPLVRIDVVFGLKDARRWPPLYIEPHVDTPSDCAFDVVSRRCRSET